MLEETKKISSEILKSERTGQELVLQSNFKW
jgi:hypothetical protein